MQGIAVILSSLVIRSIVSFVLHLCQPPQVRLHDYSLPHLLSLAELS